MREADFSANSNRRLMEQEQNTNREAASREKMNLFLMHPKLAGFSLVSKTWRKSQSNAVHPDDL